MTDTGRMRCGRRAGPDRADTGRTYRRTYARTIGAVTIPQSFVQELLARVDLVEIVGRHVALRKGGANFLGLCPFHGEKSPSFTVSPVKQFYHCFGCGKSGDAIRFLIEHLGLGFVEAVQELAGQIGLQVPDDGAGPQDRERAAAARSKRLTLTGALEQAAAAYQRQLQAAPRARAYLQGRGVSHEVARRYGLGYAPEGWRGLASVFAQYDDPLLEECGLVIASDRDGGDRRYDRFRDRVMFPIRNVKGECIGFGGRVLDGGGAAPPAAAAAAPAAAPGPKYLNSPETPVFHKGRELYGLFEAREAIREQGYALVTEGYMDVVALAQLGFANAVATLGTACTPEHVQKLLRFTDSVVFSFDGDAAGRRAARKALDAALPHASDTRSIKFLFLPAEHDPDSFIRAHGTQAFASLVQQAVALSRFLPDAARADCDLTSAEGRAHMASNARPLWTALPDGVLKRQLLTELAALTQLDARDLADLWNHAPARLPPAAAQPPDHWPPPAQAPLHDGHPGPGGYGAPGAGYAGYGAGGYGSGHAGGYARPGGRGGYGADARPPWRKGADWKAGNWKRRGADAAPWPAQPRLPRTPPLSRADHAARLLLAHMAFLEELGNDDHAMLCAQPAPHGPLFAWLETLFHEHGPLTWAQLQERLREHEHEHEALAHKLMTGPHAAIEGDPDPQDVQEWRLELRDLLNRMQIEDIKEQQKLLVLQVAQDPTALARWRVLEQRHSALRSATAGRAAAL